MYTQQISLDGLFDDSTELEISHYNVLEGDTINSFVELIDFSELDIDPFLTFSHDTSLNTLVFSIGEFEISNNYTKLIYRKTGQADEEYILQ